jgi:MAF protein
MAILFLLDHLVGFMQQPPTQLPKILLASGSIYRQQLLARLGIVFSSQSPEIDESMQAGESVPELVSRLGLAKANALRQQEPEAWIIASDQSAVCDGMLLGKPKSFAVALQQLTHQQGKCVSFYTSLVLDLPDGRVFHHVDETQVWFRQLKQTQLTSYLLQEQPYNCAGAFKSEGLGIALFERISSDDPSALIGLPLIRLANWLTDLAVLLPTPTMPEQFC